MSVAFICYFFWSFNNLGIFCHLCCCSFVRVWSGCCGFYALFCVHSRSSLPRATRVVISTNLSSPDSAPFGSVTAVCVPVPDAIFACPACVCFCPSAPMSDPPFLLFVPYRPSTFICTLTYPSVIICAHPHHSHSIAHHINILGKFPRPLTMIHVLHDHLCLPLARFCVPPHPFAPPHSSAPIHAHLRPFLLFYMYKLSLLMLFCGFVCVVKNINKLLS